MLDPSIRTNSSITNVSDICWPRVQAGLSLLTAKHSGFPFLVGSKRTAAMHCWLPRFEVWVSVVLPLLSSNKPCVNTSWKFCYPNFRLQRWESTQSFRVTVMYLTASEVWSSILPRGLGLNRRGMKSFKSSSLDKIQPKACSTVANLAIVN